MGALMMIIIIIVKRSIRSGRTLRITKERAAENHDRVLDAAAKLFREKGFDGVGVAELMGAAGLTHGGFYNHFDSKEAVEAAACERIFETSIGKLERIAETPGPEARAGAFEEYQRRYVSPAARDAAAAACPMVAFAGDVARKSAQVRAAYAEGLAAYLDAFARAHAGVSPDPEARATAIRRFCEMVGALTLARSLARDAPELSDEILRAARSQARAIADTSRP